MKERPIIFSTPMVQAILEGRKSQTRRVIKPQPPENMTSFGRGITGLWVGWDVEGNEVWNTGSRYQLGDRLWVRETWREWCPEYIPMIQYKAGGERHITVKEYESVERVWPKGFRPPRFMPKRFARLWLEVINVRVERVQEISEDDAKAEGMIAEGWTTPPVGSIGFPDKIKTARFPLGQFSGLWDSLNAKRGYGWDQNPWVWAIEFRRIDAPQ